MGKDWFATFAAKRNADTSDSRATRATRATRDGTPQKTYGIVGGTAVAHAEDPRATRATPEPAPVATKAGRVAGVAQTPPEPATVRATPKPLENCGVPGSVAHVAHVAQENKGDTHEKVASDWDVADWQAFFEERAGIGEHEGGLARADAERQAHEHSVMEWLWRCPPPASGPAWCAHCGEPIGELGRDGLPFLTGGGGHVWLHSVCHGDWTAQHRAEAVVALAILGLRAPTEAF